MDPWLVSHGRHGEPAEDTQSKCGNECRSKLLTLPKLECFSASLHARGEVPVFPELDIAVKGRVSTIFLNVSFLVARQRMLDKNETRLGLILY